MKKLLWMATVVAFPFLGIIAIQLLKIPVPLEKDCLVVSGTVTDIYEAGDRDVVFRLEGQTKTFYVNRGLALGLDLHTLQTTLLNKQILIKYPEHFTGAGHISKIEADGKTIFTELKH
jgi:hypothetical protein